MYGKLIFVPLYHFLLLGLSEKWCIAPLISFFIVLQLVRPIS